jgi:hypothetical protein
MSKLVRWETPFTNTKFPSVALIVTSASDKWNDVKALVMPLGTDKYPKYLVSFGEVIAFTCFEEAHAPERDFSSATMEERELCAYQYFDSPWIKTYEDWVKHTSFPNEPVPLFHYLIFGGDNNIEVVTTTVPTLRKIEQSEILQMELNF